MMRRKFYLSCTLLLLMAISAFAQDDTVMPSLIEFERQGVTPEGIVWDKERDRFLVSSVAEGTIFSVSDDGELTPFIEDEALVSTFGLHIDEANDRLLVANSNATVMTGMVEESLSQLVAYELDTGEQLFLVDLGSLVDSTAVMANDITIDDDGNAYVTDSLANTIFKVSPDGEPSILLQDERFAVPNNIGLNGIDYHPDGYLLVTVPFQLALYKIPLDTPNDFTLVEMQPSFGGDGIVLNNDVLTAVAFSLNSDGEVYANAIQVESEDDWSSATITRQTRISCAATTLTIRDNFPFYVTAYLSVPQQEVYQISRPILEDFEGDTDSLFSGDICRTL